MCIKNKVLQCYKTNPELFKQGEKLKFLRCYILKYFKKLIKFNEIDNIETVLRAWRDQTHKK